MPEQNPQMPPRPVFTVTANAVKVASDLYHGSRNIMKDTFPDPEKSITQKPFEVFVRFTAYCVMQGVLMAIMLADSLDSHERACKEYDIALSRARW